MALQDERHTAHGWPRVIFICLAIAALIFTWRGVVASTAEFQKGNGLGAALTLFSALAWLAGSVGIIHNGRRMRMVAYTSWTINLCAPFVALAAPISTISAVSPWYAGGATYWYAPTLGALAALLWLVWSSPAKIATRNGG